jgi:hypothetical protein
VSHSGDCAERFAADGLERIALRARLSDLDTIADLELIRGDVHGATVDSEVAVRNELARLRSRQREAGSEHHVVEPQLQHPEEVLAGDAGAAVGRLEVVPELALQHEVDAAHLLLLAQLQTVLADLAAADAVLTRRGGPALE